MRDLSTRLSVIIPTHNRPQTLCNTLVALGEQTLPADRFEVLVVDDGSEENHRVALRAYRESFNFSLIEKEQEGNVVGKDNDLAL